VIRAVEPESPHADALWMKESLARVKMALPNGFCTLPLQKSCAHRSAIIQETSVVGSTACT